MHKKMTAARFLSRARGAVAVALAAALAAPAFSSPAPPPPVSGSRLEGRVLGPDGKPVRGAVVTVRSLSGDLSWQSLPTDTGGRYAVRALPYGWADLTVTTGAGGFLGDEPVNLPPGTKVVVNFSLVEGTNKPASWWTDRRIERPGGGEGEKIAGMALSSRRLTGIEYLKSPAGLAVVASVAVVALGLIARSGGRKPATTLTTP
jgi:hypothetical protein